jgi:hypothetical protein
MDDRYEFGVSLEIYKKRHFGTEFTDPDIEAQYDDYAKDKYYREDVPFQVGGFIILCCVLLYYLICKSLDLI